MERFGALTSSTRALPDFLIVGGQRCGTNSLYEYLAAHPSIAPAMPSQEVHYFDIGFNKGSGWYRGHFPTRATMRRVEARSGLAMTGESSPYYMFHPLAPERIARTLPEVKLFVLLRDPIGRAFSQYHHARARGYETLSFEDALAAEAPRLEGEVDRIRADHDYSSFSHQQLSYVTRGVYVDQLEVLFSLFPRRSVKVIISERMFAEPERSTAEALEFLGLPPWPTGSYARHNRGNYRDSMDPALARLLGKRFADANDRLARLLDIELPW